MDTLPAWHQSRSLYFVINTYDSITADATLQFMHEAFHELLQPYVPDDTEYAIVYYKGKPPTSKLQRPNTVNWQKLRAAFPVRACEVQFDRQSNIKRWTTTGVGGAAVNFEDDPARTSYLTFNIKVEEAYPDSQVPFLVQSKVVELATSLFETVSGVTGYITVDYVGANCFFTDSPYERWIGYSSIWASREYRIRTRGYYWGNFISIGHVELLGGIEKLKQAPVFLLKELGNGYYFQLTDDINNIDRNKLHEFKRFLEPVLPRLPEDWPYPPKRHDTQGPIDYVL